MHVCVELMVCTLIMMSEKDSLLSGCVLVGLCHPPGGPEHAKTQRLISEEVPHLKPLSSLTPCCICPILTLQPKHFFCSCSIQYLTPLFCRLDSPERNSRKLICFMEAAAFCVYREPSSNQQIPKCSVGRTTGGWGVCRGRGGWLMGTMMVISAWERDSQSLR